MPSTEVTFWTPVSKVWGQHGPARSRKTPTIERIDTSKKTCRIIEKLKLQGQRRRGAWWRTGEATAAGGERCNGGVAGRPRFAAPLSARIRPPVGRISSAKPLESLRASCFGTRSGGDATDPPAGDISVAWKTLCRVGEKLGHSRSNAP